MQLDRSGVWVASPRVSCAQRPRPSQDQPRLGMLRLLGIVVSTDLAFATFAAMGLGVTARKHVAEYAGTAGVQAVALAPHLYGILKRQARAIARDAICTPCVSIFQLPDLQDVVHAAKR